MNCLKCGVEIEETQVFCEDCREVMKKYPVKPGIAIQFPKREDAPAVIKKTLLRRKSPLSPEDQIRVLRRRMRSLMIVWLVTLLLLGATIYPTVEFIRNLDIRLPGQNYSTYQVESTEEP